MNGNMKVAILGAGTMGIGIAQLFASAGCQAMLVYVYDDKIRSKPFETMKDNLKVLVENNMVDEADVEGILSRVTCTEDINDVAGFDMVIECIVENLEVKQDYFKLLDEMCGADTILATNTSAISVTQIAQKAKNKDRIIGTHFWNPAYLIPLVEVIQTEFTSQTIIDRTFDIMKQAGKKPVLVKKDVPGFLANRMQHALFREAISIVENGIASAQDVDDAIKYGFGMRLGVRAPIEVIDRGGIDLTYSIHKYLFPHIESSTSPSKMLTDMLDNNQLGSKTGQGFLKWSEEDIEKSDKNLIEGLIKVIKVLQ